eukprot:gene1977-8887_t
MGAARSTAAAEPVKHALLPAHSYRYAELPAEVLAARILRVSVGREDLRGSAMSSSREADPAAAGGASPRSRNRVLFHACVILD